MLDQENITQPATHFFRYNFPPVPGGGRRENGGLVYGRNIAQYFAQT